MKNIVIKGAREHNLKNIDVTLPRDKFIVITGISGSGKSTLAFDTLYAEGQRRYVESLSSYARQFLGIMNKPDVDAIDGLSPAISIEQKATSKNPRSTVGTVTEIYDYLRLLFARIGTPHCPEHKIEIQAQSAQRIAQSIAEKFQNQITVLSPIVQQKKGTYEQLIKDLNKDGYARVRINKIIQRTDEPVKLERYVKHDIEIVIDRLNTNDLSRLTEAVEQALIKGDGLLQILDENEKIHTFSAKLACPKCGIAFEELQPRMFSFNSPFGACEECNGLGVKTEFDPNLVIPDKTKSIMDGAIALYGKMDISWRGQQIQVVGKKHKFDIFTPISNFNDQQLNVLLYGSNKPLKGRWSNGASMNFNYGWEGIIPQSDRLYKQTESDWRRRNFEKYMRSLPCQECKGKRLKDKILAVTINEKSIHDVTTLPISDCIKYINNLNLTKKQQKIAQLILKEIKTRLAFLDNVGLSYLNLSRHANTLSGGEAQRIRLATQIGSNLMGVLYILDEPSIGLHQRDNEKLIDTLHKLRDLGNTLVVVEHDEDTIARADYVIDIGPGAGIHGGKITAIGTPNQIKKNPYSITGQYLSGKKTIAQPKKRRKSSNKIFLYGAKENNLKNLDLIIPTGVLTCITGVSGSGKSSLIQETLYKALMQKLHNSKDLPGKHDSLHIRGEVDKVIVIDQSPIGRTPRSNPATYIKVFDDIRYLFASTRDAQARGFKAGRFSFNVPGGRCEKCQGDGTIKIEMNFLPDVYVECEDCKGARYNKETLEILYKGKSIADILNMSVEDALKLFENVPNIHRKINTLQQVGLDYIKVGQSSTTLSGGEAQRIKLTRELAKRSTGKTLYLLDEPTTGLHFHDINQLLVVLQNLVNKGNTMIVIEHNLDIIKCADHIIDLGPEGGNKGGYIVAQGTPEEIASNPNSYTGLFLKKVLKKLT
jgi:excinuclease ABC subunit A